MSRDLRKESTDSDPILMQTLCMQLDCYQWTILQESNIVWKYPNLLEEEYQEVFPQNIDKIMFTLYLN